MPPAAFAFDAYGTLFDVHAAIRRHSGAVGPHADALSALWRAKQLEYSWVRTLMGRYEDFWALTEQALDFALARFPAADPSVRSALLDAYRRLDVYPDVIPALAQLRNAGHRLAIFTNGTEAMAEAAATASGVRPLIDDIVSVDEVRAFKTSPQAYAHLCRRMGMGAHEICLVSSNRWDIAGGASFGLRTAWVNRTAQPDEYADSPPGRTLQGLDGLIEA
jgi:2-haloacid dehalogenase